MTDEPDLKSRPVRAGETPLDASFGHRYLDVIRDGGDAFNSGTQSPYSGHSLEHCLHATGWVQRDLRVALDKVLMERTATEARHAAELRELKERFSEAVAAYSRLWSKRTPSRDEYNTHFAPFIIPSPDPLESVVQQVARELGLIGASSLHTIRADDFRSKLHAALRKIGDAGESPKHITPLNDRGHP